MLRRDYPTQPTEELAKEFGTSIGAVRQKAIRLRLRKTPEYLAARSTEARRQPLGTERLCTGDKNRGIVLVKVSNHGTQSQQWRPKHHVIWQQTNGKRVPPGFRVIFKDGNKANFDPENLELATREEISAKAFAQFFWYPPPLQQSIKLTRQLQREVRTRTEGETSRSSQARREKPKGSGGFRWTAEQKDILRRDYARRPTKEVAARLGMSVRQIRVQARRLGVKRDPDIMIAEAKQKAAALNAQALG